MPAGSFDMYYMNDRRNHLEAMRPAPICTENQVSGHNNVHISTNCYYGYHNPKIGVDSTIATDCEMTDAVVTHVSSQSGSLRKRSASDVGFPPNKRYRQDDCSIGSLVGTRSSPSHAASALNINIFIFLFMS